MKGFLQDVNQRITPWFSDADISAGERWASQLAIELDSTEFGIICTTQDALESHWVLFEAGALSRAVKVARVCPYLIDLTQRQLSGPLAQFQAKEATQEQTWELLQSINLSMAQEALPETRLRRYFDTFWPALAGEIDAANADRQIIPRALYRKMLDVLPPLFYEVGIIKVFAVYADLPIWNINLNQAAVHVWRELLELAVTQRKLGSLFDVLARDNAQNGQLQELTQLVKELIPIDPLNPE